MIQKYCLILHELYFTPYLIFGRQIDCCFGCPGGEKNWVSTRASEYSPCVVNKDFVLFPTKNEILPSLLGTFPSHKECKLNRPRKFSATELYKGVVMTLKSYLNTNCFIKYV